MTAPRRTVLAAAALLALLALLFAPTLAWLWRSWLVHPYYAHGPLVPLVAAWFAWRGRARLNRRPSDLGLLLLGAGLLAHLLSLSSSWMPLSAGGLLFALVGLAAVAWGRSGLRVFALPAALLAAAVPLPYAERLAPPLAATVAHAAATAAAAAGAGVERAGAQLTVAGGSFTVGAPCSGLHSLLALATLAMVLAGVMEGRPVRRALMVCAAVPLALGANWLRLTGLIVVSDSLGPERGLALFHAAASPLAYLLAAALLVAFGRLIDCHVPVRA